MQVIFGYEPNKQAYHCRDMREVRRWLAARVQTHDNPGVVTIVKRGVSKRYYYSKTYGEWVQEAN